MNRRIGTWLAGSVLFLFAGCNGSSNPAAPATEPLSDEEEINQIMEEEMSEYFTSDFLASDETSASNKTSDAIDTDRWHRRIEERSGNVNIEFPGDGTAEVVVRTYVQGTLFLVDEIDSFTTVEYQKPFADSIVRRAVMRRLPMQENRPPHRRWYLESVSMGEAVSQPASSVSITSVEVTNLTSGYNEVWTDPYALMDRETEIPLFDAGDEIEVVVTTGSSGLLGFLHVDHHRLEMTDNGDGTYSGTWVVPERSGPHTAAFDMLTSGTILDNNEAYDGNAWAAHYRVQ